MITVLVVTILVFAFMNIYFVLQNLRKPSNNYFEEDKRRREPETRKFYNRRANK